MDANTIIIAFTALYLLFVGSMMKTQDIPSAILFKVLPMLMAFFLGLSAFKVI